MYKIIKLISIAFLLLVFSNSNAQDKTIDSLKVVLQNPKIHDSTKLYSITFLMENNYNEGDPKYYYLNTILGKLALKNYSEKNPAHLHRLYSQFLGSYYSALMIEYGEKRDVLNALISINKSIAIFKKEKLYDDMYFSMITKGTFLSKINESEKGIAYLFSALKYFEKNKQKNGDEISYVQSSIAAIYLNQEKYEKAIEYFKAVLIYFDSKKDINTQDLYQKSTIYANCGSAYLSLKNYPKAIDNLKAALSLSKKINNSTTISVVLSKIAQVKMEELKYDEAEFYLKESLKGSISDLGKANSFIKLGKLYYEKNNFNLADYYLSKGLQIATNVKNIELQEQATELLFKVSKKSKNFEKALEIHQIQDVLKDSAKIEASKNALAQQQLKYDFEKKELNLKLSAQKKNTIKNNWLIALSGTLLLLLLGGYFYYRSNKQKQAITVLEKNQIKQKLLITQMNPHFIFNSIDNIQSLIYNNQDQEAIKYLNKFSKLTRQILENSTENYISLDEELEMIENYLIIQQLLYNNKFDYQLTVEDKIDTEALLLPPMLTQPFIENAIKHGLNNRTVKGKIDINFYLKDDKLFFDVTDNGTGFDSSKKSENHKSLAMTITKERLVNYTKNHNFVVKTDNIIDDNGTSVGAKVVFEIPYIYEK